MQTWLTLLDAAQAAARWHVDQRKKGTEEPYINHLLEVAALVGEATGGNDPNLVLAALMHDAVEHQGVPIGLIAGRYGQDVAALVMEVTDDKSLPESERQARQAEAAAKASARAKLLRLADKISNLRAFAARPPADWPLKRRLDYVAAARKVVSAMSPVHDGLGAAFEAAAAAAEARLIPGQPGGPRSQG